MFVLLFVKGLNATFKYFERKLSNDGKEFECKDVIQFSFNMRKMSLVNETLRLETEMRPRRLTFSPRRDRDRDVPTFLRDRDETETLEKCVSRPSRDRDVEAETTSLLQRISQIYHWMPD